MGRLPPVLHALPLSADAAGLQGPAVPRAASAARSTASRRPRRGRCCPRAGAACSPTSSCTRGSRPATATPAAARSSATSSARGSARRCSTPTCASSRSSSAGSSSSPAARPGPSTGARTPTATRRPPARPSSSAPPPRATPSGLVWDLGCNDGTYSRVAAEHAATVVALDGDHATVDGLYRALRDEGRTDILPLVMSVTDPSPDLGWRGLERARPERRGTPDLALAPRAHPPRGHHRQRPRARVRRLAAHRSRPRW